MSDTPKVSAVLTARAKASIALPPSEMGWADLISPKGFEADAPKLGEGAVRYSLDCHFTPAGLEALSAKVLKDCLEAQLEELTKAAAAQKTKLKPPISIEEWLEGKLKQPKPKARIQTPFIKVTAPGYRKDRNGGDPILNVMGCWGPLPEQVPLSLPKLRLSAGSVVQAIVFPNLFASKAAMWIPQPALKLVGIRVLKPVSFGGSRGPQASQDGDDEAIKAVMGADFDIHGTDLSAYAAGGDDAPPVEDHDDDSLEGVF